jgi:hypothetical protein
MKKGIIILAVLMTSLIFSGYIGKNNGVVIVDADSIVAHIDRYKGKIVKTEGLIVHICGIDGLKMKLKTKGGAYINIVSKDTLVGFNKDFMEKKVKVQGLVKEYRIEKEYIDKMEKEKTLLCHIDYSPCKDSIWVNKQIKSGKSDTLSKNTIDKLKLKLEQSGKNYISVVSIIAEKLEIIEEPKK